MKPLLFVQWIVTLIICFWAGALIFALSCSQPPRPSGWEKHQTPISEGGASQPNTPSFTSSHGVTGYSGQNNTENKTAEWWMVGVSVLSLLVAIVQLCYFRGQLRNMDLSLRTTRRAVEETKRSDERQLRAYVSIWMKEITPRTEHETVAFKFVAMNHGATPAKKLGFRAVRWRFVGDIPKGYQPETITGDWNVERSNVFPHSTRADAETMATNCDLGIPIPIEECNALGLRHDVWVIGLEIQYWDVFTTTEHITREYFRIFCEWDAKAKENKIKISVVPKGSFVS